MGRWWWEVVEGGGSGKRRWWREEVVEGVGGSGRWWREEVVEGGGGGRGRRFKSQRGGVQGDREGGRMMGGDGQEKGKGSREMT